MVVTELGSEAAVHDVVVEASNWMTALTLGRSRIGERGGVPPGATCKVSPEGTVSLTDAIARREYHLEPTTASVRPPAPSEPPAPTPGAASQAPAPTLDVRVSRRTVAFDASSLGVVPAPKGSSPPAARSISVPPPRASSKPPATSASSSAPKHAVSYAAPRSAPPAPAAPPPETPEAPAAAPASPAPSDASPVGTSSSARLGPIAEQLFSRDEEPSEQSPLLYRERHYHVPEGTPTSAARILLEQLFTQLQESIADRPKGKLVKMAMFDHRWEGRPARPPILTLQWKDWRGEPEIIDGATAVQQAQIAAQAEAARVSAPPAEAPRTSAAPVVAPEPTPAAPEPTPAAPEPTPAAPVAAPAAAPASVPPAEAPTSSLTAPPAERVSPQSSSPGSLARERLADAFEGLQDLFFLQSALDGAEFLTRLVQEVIPCDGVSVALYDINENEMRFVAASGAGGTERKGEAIPITQGLIGEALRVFGSCHRVDDVASSTLFDPGIDGRVGLEVTTMLLKPVHHEGRLLGILQLLNRQNDFSFSGSDESVLAYISDKFGEFLAQQKASSDRPRRAAKRS